jgi:DNA-binding transcriptional LysR family regulator
MNIASLNLNLLVVLHAALEERSASRAALRLNVTQSAVSNALGRLRRVLGDELLVRTGRGLSPTPKALELQAGLRLALEQLQGVMASRAFDPASSRREFVLADTEEFSELPRLAREFRIRFPLARFRVISVQNPLDAVLSGDADLVIATGERSPASLHRRRLGGSRLLRVVRRGSPLAQRPPSSWHDVPAISVRVPAREPQRACMVMPDFMSACLAVSLSDCFTLVPENLVKALTPLMPIEALDAVGPSRVTSIWWHARTHSDVASRAFRQLVFEVVQRGGSARRPAGSRPISDGADG